MTGIFYTAQHLICILRLYYYHQGHHKEPLDDDHKSQLYFSYSRDIILQYFWYLQKLLLW